MNIGRIYKIKNKHNRSIIQCLNRNFTTLSCLENIYSNLCNPSPHRNMKLRNTIQQLCQDKGLNTVIDETGNLIVKIHATSGMENRKTVVMQGHIDMAPQKNSDSNHNFETAPCRA